MTRAINDRAAGSARARGLLLSSSALVAVAVLFASGAGHAAAVLPTGGVVASGKASIAAPSATTMVVNQSSTNAIINWQSFSIGQGDTVQINNGSGATLNRVTGPTISSINGLLSATGSVYLVNANGVIVGKTGVVSTGGTFVASTLDLSNSQFLSGGTLTFSGTSTASVVNLGKVGSLGGNVAMIAATVQNQGTITAPNGDVGLVAGYQVTLSDADNNGDGLFSVQLGGTGTSVTNAGLIEAASAELRAQQGNVYALAGNTTGVIRATGVGSQGGQIWLVADGGTTTVAGTLDAQSANGAPGQIETSGQTVVVDAAAINAHGGNWLLDPTDIEITQAAATTISDALNAGSSVTESTTNGEIGVSSGSVVTTNGSGNITLDAGATIAWSTNSSLTLAADNNITLNGTITVSGAGALNLQAPNGALAINAPITVSGAGQVNLTYNANSPTNLSFGLTSTGFTGSLSFTGPEGGGQALYINGPTAYTLLYTLGEIASIDTTGDGGNYALASSLTGTGFTYANALVGANGNIFTGVFEGLGHTITGLTINASPQFLGMFGESSGAIRDIGLVGGSVTSTFYGGTAGGLVGWETGGSITNAYDTGSVTAGYYATVGGLVGSIQGGSISLTNVYATGAVSDNSYSLYAGGLVGDIQSSGSVSITNAYATGSVSNGGGNYGYVGGLVGESEGASYGAASITNAYATGAVSGGSEDVVGGLLGYNNGYYGTASVSNVYSTGAVTGGSTLGGLVGSNQGQGGGTASVSNAYWDTTTSGRTTDNGGATGLTTDQLQGLATLSGGGLFNTQTALGSAFGGGTGGLFPYLASFFPNGAQAISGTAYSNSSGTTAVGTGTAVTILADGVLGSVSTGVGGYYYLAVPAGTLSTGSAVLAYTSSGAVLTQATGTISGLSIDAISLLELTSAATYSTLPLAAGLLAEAEGSNSAAMAGINSRSVTYLTSSATGFTFDQALTLASALDIQTTVAGTGITVAAPITVGGETLTLDASIGALAINAPITVTNSSGTAGAVNLTYNTASPTNLSFAIGGSIDYGATANGGTLHINGQAYTLLYALSDDGSTAPDGGPGDIAGIDTMGDAGFYALATNLNGTGTTFTSALAGAGSNTFTGTLEGLGHTITGLTINDAIDSSVGLFGTSSGTIRDISLIGGSVTGSVIFADVGGLVGWNQGEIISASTTGTVSGGQSASVGGLVGENENGSFSVGITNAYASGAVSGGVAADVGGLVGFNYGDGGAATISNVYATGAVTGGDLSTVGGLVGENLSSSGAATIANAYATGAVSGAIVGGLVGVNSGGTVSTAYWDTQTTGTTTDGSGSGAIGLTTAQFQSGGAGGLGSAFAGGTGGLYPYLASFYPNGVQVISGTAYSDGGSTPLASGASGAQYVTLLTDGVVLDSVTTGANGYYYVLLPAGTVPASDSLLAFTQTSGGGATLAAATGLANTNQGGVNIYGGVVAETTSALTYSAADVTFSGVQSVALMVALGNSTAAGDIIGATGLGVIATGASFTVDQSLTTGGLSALVIQTASGAPLTVAAGISVNNDTSLSLLSGGALAINAPITAEGAATVNLAYDVGMSTVSPTDLSFGMTATGFSGGLTYTDADGGAITSSAGGALNINGQAYTLLYTLANSGSTGADGGTNDIAGIDANTAAGGDGGFYALANNLNGAGTAFTSALAGANGNAFTGVFEGLGHTITGLTINDTTNQYVGLFGTNSGVLRDIGLVGGSVGGGLAEAEIGALTGRNFSYDGAASIINAFTTDTVSGGLDSVVGGLVGVNGSVGGTATISNAYATGAVSGDAAAGGLVGMNESNGGTASITGAYATGAVSGDTNDGGLVGMNFATSGTASISSAYATGAVSGGQSVQAGGLVGMNYATGGTASITDTYATGAVSGGDGASLGGLVGVNYGYGGAATVTNSFWDISTTGQTADSGQASALTGAGSINGYDPTTGAIGLTTAQLQGLATLSDGTLFNTQTALGSAFSGGANGLYPYLASFYPNGAQAVSGYAYGANGAAASGAQVAVYDGGEAIGDGTTSVGANGYVYTLVPAGTFSSTGNAIGVTLTGAAGVSGLSYADGLSLNANGNLISPNLTAGLISEATTTTSESALSASLGTTFGQDNLTALTNTLSGASLQITAAGGFTIDQAISNSGSVTVQAGGDLAIGASGSVSSTASGDAVTLETSGDFINGAGSAAVSAANGAWLIYSAGPTGDVFDNLNSNNTAIWDAAVGTGVSASGDRYVFAYQPTLTITSTSDSKTYGSDAASQIQADYTISGLQQGVAGAFEADTAASVLTGAPVVTSAGAGATASVLGGPYTITVSAGTMTSTTGYALAFNSAGVLTVNPLALTASLTGPVTATYNGATAATLNSGDYTLTGFVAGQGATVDQTSGTYASANAGTGIGVTATLGASSYTANAGTVLSNYILPTSATGQVGTITPAVLTASITGSVTATYNGTTGATLNSGDYTLTGFVAGQGATVDQTSGTYASANAGTGIGVTATLGASSYTANAGTALSNYILPTSATGQVGTITPAVLTASITGSVTKSSDGATAATLNSGDYTLSGFVAGQGATVDQTSGTYASAAIGTGILVSATLTSADYAANAGTLLSNYILPTLAVGAVGQITAPLTLPASAEGVVANTSGVSSFGGPTIGFGPSPFNAPGEGATTDGGTTPTSSSSNDLTTGGTNTPVTNGPGAPPTTAFTPTSTVPATPYPVSLAAFPGIQFVTP